MRENLLKLSKEKKETLNKIVNDLKRNENVIAIVLGGSYAAGTATEASDIDIGIYYFEKEPFNINDIKAIARKYSINDAPTVTDFYEWGPWVNGGAWIETSCGKVDFLYRNIEQVISTIEKAKNGEWENHFEQQPPYGFSSIIYLAESKICTPLYDPNEVIKKLKTEVQTYPTKLKESVIQQSLWAAQFSIYHLDHFSKNKDIYYTIGCLTRAVKNVVTALFAINELYPISDKRAIEILIRTDKRLVHLREKIEKILCIDKNAINNNFEHLKTLFRETVELTNGAYKSLYNLKKT